MAGRKMADKKEKPGGGGGEEMATGLFYSQKLGYDLMQNCDLPPPMKVYANNNIYPPNKTPVSQKDGAFLEISDKISDYGDDKLELLKALTLSQTRAREAERKVALLSKEKNDLTGLLIRQSMELFAYKHWLKMMEFGASKLEKQQGKGKAEPPDRVESSPNWPEQNRAQGITFLVAVAICVSIAGAGFLSFFSSHCH